MFFLPIPYNGGIYVYKGGHVIFSCRIGTSSLGEGEVCLPRRKHHRWEGVVSFGATRLVVYSVFLLALSRELLLDGPWACPRSRVFDGDLVFEGVRAGPRPALDQVQVLAGALKISLWTEVRHVDHERIAFPMAARVTIPLADVGRQVGTPVHEDVPLPASPLTHVVEHRDAPRGLHDPPEAPAERAS